MCGDGDGELRTDPEVALLAGCEEIGGDLVLSGAVSDLTPLASLRRVGGRLRTRATFMLRVLPWNRHPEASRETRHGLADGRRRKSDLPARPTTRPDSYFAHRERLTVTRREGRSPRSTSSSCPCREPRTNPHRQTRASSSRRVLSSCEGACWLGPSSAGGRGLHGTRPWRAGSLCQTTRRGPRTGTARPAHGTRLAPRPSSPKL